MNYTTNLNLKKPAYSDPADIVDINDNMDIIDGIEPKLTYALADVVESKNLINEDAFSAGFISTAGVVYTGGSYDNYTYSDFIDVSKHIGDTLYFSFEVPTGKRTAATARVVVAYDDEKQAIPSKGADGSYNTYTIPEGIKYVRLCFANTYFNDLQAEYDEITDYEPYHADYYALKGSNFDSVNASISEIKEITDEISIVEENLVNPAEIVDAHYYWNGSMASAGATYFHTGKIPVTGGEKLWISGSRFVYCFVGNTGRADLSDNTIHATAWQFTVPDTVTDIIITEYTNHKATFMVNRGSKMFPYIPYGEKNIKVNLDNSKGEIATASLGDLKVFLPSTIYVAVGRTIELYNEQICINKNVNFQWISNVGKRLKRKLSITGTNANVGTYTVTLNLYNNANEKIWTGTMSVVIYQPSIAATKKIVCIGDSWTNSKAWESELINLSGEKIDLVGTRHFSVKDADNITRTGYHEGRSGWTAQKYLEETEYSYEHEGVHPFWDDANGRFNWSYYVDNSLSGNEPDAVVIMLGTNGLTYDNTTACANEKQMVDFIRQDDSDIPIVICTPAYWGNQNGLGVQTSNDGFASNTNTYELGQDTKIMDLQTKLYDTFKDYTNLHFAFISLCFDREYNYGAVETSVNPRASQTELMPVEAVHPQAQGYYQTADIIYSAIANLL